MQSYKDHMRTTTSVSSDDDSISLYYHLSRHPTTLKPWARTISASAYIMAGTFSHHLNGLSMVITLFSLIQNTTITTPLASRIYTAASAIDPAIQQLDFDFTYSTKVGGYFGILDSTRLHIALCLFDHITNQTRYKNRVGDFFDWRGNAGNANIPVLESQLEIRDTSVEYGYAAFHAYLAYHNSTFLQLAEEAWNRANKLVISDQNLDVWDSLCPLNREARSFSDLLHHFRGKTSWRFPGGLGTVDNATYYIGANVNGKFLALSGLLAKETFNRTYVTAAKSTAAFMTNNMFRGRSTGNPQSIHVFNNCTVSFDNPTAENTAWWIDGVSLLTAIDTQGSPSAMDLYSPSPRIPRLKQAIVGPANTNWINEYGILDTVSIDRGHVVSAITQAYGRMNQSTGKDLQSYISTFVAVQHNAVVNNARAPNSNLYREWTVTTSPGPAAFDIGNQVSAIYALLAGISLPDQKSVDPTVETPTGPTSIETGSTTNPVHTPEE
ncbi:hypothetical protein VNI00_010448 [Paramarasmius palmivorus]|uniref:Uncharacterized protein n=1 Tax=Paramarasmius palmivorus TaxID=297713 RepID=A0AAW0CGW6_9AGAR